ncbi:hypothetical protein [Streptomyces sp. NPDC018055]|uniref:hypothetical protein n=1 Tax=Streptomyces sp. NPDC018055 TaxID=3365038 RepID=UPI0037AF57A8
MDPMSLEQLLFELSSTTPATMVIPADRLTPGCVLAGTEWDRHVVTATPILLSATVLSVPVRHLYGGGHTLTRRYSRDGQVTIYRNTLAARDAYDVPSVPRCFVPGDPETGDRVYHCLRDTLSLGQGRFYEYDGGQWRRVSVVGADRPRTTVTLINNLATVVSSPSESCPAGWYTYQPAGHAPHLYVDGQPMPARLAAELQVGDILRLPGGGRLEVRRARRTADDVVSLTLELVSRSKYQSRQLSWVRRLGDTIEHHDSGRTQTLYATEPRPSELLTSAELHPEDTVITSWGSRSSTVATVTDVWRQPVRAIMHLHATANDGRLMRIQSGIEPRHLLLHRVSQQPLRATA